MIIVVLVVCMPYVLTWSHHRIITAHLQSHNCDTSLYWAVRNAKSRVPRAEALRVETSIKVVERKVIGEGRYIIPVLLSEYNTFSQSDREAILAGVHMKQSEITELIGSAGPRADIIFGVDGDKGKVYIDQGTRPMRLTCLESDGTKKEYYEVHTTRPGVQRTLKVTKNGSAVGHHYYLEKPMGAVYWIAKMDGYTSYYTRPTLNGIWIRDLASLCGVPHLA